MQGVRGDHRGLHHLLADELEDMSTKSQWDPNKVQCHVCGHPGPLRSLAEQDGLWVLWCSRCGTAVTGSEFEPFDQAVFHTPIFQQLKGLHPRTVPV